MPDSTSVSSPQARVRDWHPRSEILASAVLRCDHECDCQISLWPLLVLARRSSLVHGKYAPSTKAVSVILEFALSRSRLTVRTTRGFVLSEKIVIRIVLKSATFKKRNLRTHILSYPNATMLHCVENHCMEFLSIRGRAVRICILEVFAFKVMVFQWIDGISFQQ
jgi:hypothetical protein